jgi:hypothetical protein
LPPPSGAVPPVPPEPFVPLAECPADDPPPPPVVPAPFAPVPPLNLRSVVPTPADACPPVAPAEVLSATELPPLARPVLVLIQKVSPPAAVLVDPAPTEKA